MITKKDSVKSLTHRHGGNGYAVVQWLPGEYCRVVFWSNVNGDAKIGDRAYLAWLKFLDVERQVDPLTKQVSQVLLPPKVVTLLEEKQQALASGKEQVISQRFVAT